MIRDLDPVVLQKLTMKFLEAYQEALGKMDVDLGPGGTDEEVKAYIASATCAVLTSILHQTGMPLEEAIAALRLEWVNLGSGKILQ